MTDTAHRLRLAREAAGYASAGDAAKAFGWAYPTYAAHENGSRGVRPDLIRRYARAFKVSALWLLDGAGDMRGGTTQRPPGEFGEPELELFVPQTNQHERLTSALTQIHASGPVKPILYKANTNYGAFGILRGDVLLVGEANRPSSLGLAVVTFADEATGESTTTLRQRTQGLLIPPIGQELDGEAEMSVGILGAVLAVLRT